MTSSVVEDTVVGGESAVVIGEGTVLVGEGALLTLPAEGADVDGLKALTW